MPNDVDPTKLFEELIKQPRPHVDVDFPRNNQEGQPLAMLKMVVLTQAETDAALASAEAHTKKILGENMPKKGEASTAYEVVFNNQKTIDVLFRACKNFDDPSKPFFPTRQAILSLTSDEIAVLANHYFTVQVQLGPVIAAMTTEEMQEYIKRIAEGGSRSAYFFNSFSWEALKELTTFMAVELLSLRTDRSSVGSLPEQPISTESTEPTTPD
jgi:hypothetical protein